MISTRFQSKLEESAAECEVITLKRPLGVAGIIEIPAKLLAPSVVGTALAIDVTNRQLKVVGDSSHILVVTDEIGIKGECQVAVHPINDECFAVELLSGSLFLHNGSDAPYGFNVDKKLITGFDPANVNWLSVEKVYDIINTFNKFTDKLATQEKLSRYLFNASYVLNLGYKAYTGTKPVAGTCYSSMSYAVKGIDNSLSFGEVHIEMTAPTPIPATKSRKDKYAAQEEESAEELLGMSSDDDEEEEDYGRYNEMPNSDTTEDEENYEIDTSGDSDLYDENEEESEEDE